MEDALGLAGGPARVEDEKRVLAVERLGGRSRRKRLAVSSCHHTSRPVFMSTSFAVRRSTITPVTWPSPSLSAASTLALSGTTLPRRQPPSAVTMSLAPLSASRSLIDSALNPPNTTVCTAPIARAGQHGHRRLGHQRQVDQHAVARRDAVRLEHVGEPADLRVQLGVGERAPVAGFAFPDDGGFVAAGLLRWRSTQFSATLSRPPRNHLAIRTVPFEHGAPRCAPEQFAGLLGPERVGMLDGEL